MADQALALHFGERRKHLMIGRPDLSAGAPC